MKHDKIKSLTLSALFVSIIAVSAQIAIPTPSGVSFTLQTFAVSLCGFYLGASKSILSMLTYILLGLVGAPVFTGFSGGLSVLVGKTGGFIAGLFFMSLCCAISVKMKPVIKWVICFFGILMCHALGCMYFSFLTDCSIKTAFVLTSLPFIVKDMVSVILAYMFSQKLKKRINQA